MITTALDHDAATAALDRLLEHGGLRSAYQPIVDLDTGATVAHEALVRGPVGSDLELPVALFGAAEELGRTVELDWHCRRAAFDGARAAGLGADSALFVNVEPSSLHAPPPDGFEGLMSAGCEDLRVVLEITERAVTAHPGALLRAIGRARAAGQLIAIDDLGADESSLALLPFIAPDVIKLDLRLIQDRPDADVARWVSSALAEHERSGAAVLAEGIETEEHLDRARAIGASLGQGYLLGRPGPLPTTPVASSWRPPSRAGGPCTAGSPYDVVAAVRPTRLSTKPMLTALSHHLEARTAGFSSPGVVLSAFQDAAHFTPDSRRRYVELARRCSLTAVFGTGLEADVAPGVRGAGLAADDPLRGEWSVLVIGAHEAAALVARDLGDRGPEHERRFTYAVTHDRDLVVEAARTLLARL